jgi:hypothetical protein
MSLDDKRRELENIILSIEGFRKPSGPWTYRGDSPTGRKVGVTFAGENFEYCESKEDKSGYRTLGTKPLESLNLDKVKPCIENLLGAYPKSQ